jgi:hypothetical protein
MPDTATTVTVTRDVVVDTLVELVQYEEILTRLNGHSDTPLTSGLTAASTGSTAERSVPRISTTTRTRSGCTRRSTGAVSSRRGNGSVSSGLELVLECIECGEISEGSARGWRAFLTDAEEEPAEVAVYCEACAGDEFDDA